MKTLSSICAIAMCLALTGCITTSVVKKGAEKGAEMAVEGRADMYRAAGAIIDAEQKSALLATCTGGSDRYNAEELTAEQYAKKVEYCATHNKRIVPDGVTLSYGEPSTRLAPSFDMQIPTIEELENE